MPVRLAMMRSVGLCAVLGAMLANSAGAASRPSVNTCRNDNFSPSSRTLAPISVRRRTGNVAAPSAVLSGRSTRLSGSGSALTLDFGKDVAGIVTLRFKRASDSQQSLGLAFTESPDYIGTSSDASQGGVGADGALTVPVPAYGSYTVPTGKLRGGFRYLTIFMQSSGWVEIDRVSLAFSAAPGAAHPNAYPNYFCSSDRLLNRIWYAGAYTVQLDTIDPAEGRVWPPPASGWDNSGLVGVGASVLVDGAKRDRTVWPGDYGISVPTDLASIGDAVSIRNGLTTLYQHQDATGAMPYAGPEVNFPGAASDTYSLWSLAATADYYLYTGDKAWLDQIWPQYQQAVSYALGKVDLRGLMFVTGTSDWAPSSAGESVEANALLYHVLQTGSQLAQAEGAASTSATYLARAASLKAAINNLLWDPVKGAYKDNGYTSNASSSPLYPQDGNSLAVWFGVTGSQAQAQQVLSYLRGNWNRYGATAPEWSGKISPFPGSMEVYARFAGGDDQDALALIRREWGYMLTARQGTGSTFWEGYDADGTLAYNASYSGAPAGNYTSLAHGWSAGPTGALTYYVLGVAPDGGGGRAYHVVPHPGKLGWADGRLSMSAGAVTVSWKHPRGGFTLTVTDRGAGTSGVIAVPRFGATRVVYVNGVKAWNGSRFLGAPGIASADQDSTYIYFRAVRPGRRTLAWGSGVTRRGRRTSRRRSRHTTRHRATAASAAASAPARLCSQQLITMSDGVRLHAWISRLAPDVRRPVLFMMDSYSRSGQADYQTGPTANSCPLALPDDYVPQWLATSITNRFTLVQVADRGTGLSEGTFDLDGPRIQQDVGEAIDWAAGQPWSNGRVVLTGESGTGFFTYYGMLNPHVKAALVFTSCPDMYRCFYRGGQYNSLAEVYLGVTNGDWAQLLQARMSEGTGANPSPPLQQAALTQDEATTKTDSVNDAWWQQRSALSILRRVRIPVMYTTDLYDIVQPFDALELTPGARLVLPMGHQSPHRTIAAGDRYEQLIRTPVDRFLAHYGLGVKNRAQRDPRVTLVSNTGSVAQFQADQLLVRGESRWPLPSTRWTPLYLGPGKSGSAHSLNDGVLSAQKPRPGSAGDAAPLLSTPHEDLRTQLLVGSEQPDLRNEESGGLTYTTPPFKHDLEITGPIALRLYATATAQDFDWAVRIADVWPDGESQWITDGYLRAELRQVNPALSLRDRRGDIVRPWLTYSTPQTVPIGQPVQYLIDIIETSNVFRAGHRLRLDILPLSEGGVDSPRSGGAGAVEILRDPAHPSSLMLPVIPSRCQRGRPMVAATPLVRCAGSYAQAIAHVGG